MNDYIKKLFVEFFKTIGVKKNHVFSSDFYAWARNKGIEVTKEFKAGFRKVLKQALENHNIKAEKTSYKSNKIYLMVNSAVLTIRKYTKKVVEVITQKRNWEPIYAELKEMYANKVDRVLRHKKYLEFMDADFTGCNEPALMKNCAGIMSGK